MSIKIGMQSRRSVIAGRVWIYSRNGQNFDSSSFRDIIKKPNGATSLDFLLGDRPNRMEAAKCFYKILDLATIGAISVNQNYAYGPISCQACNNQ